MTETETILAALRPLFREADTQGLWFYSRYQSLWFSPDQLRKQHAEGRFIWGPVNWQLRHPREMVEAAERVARDAAVRAQHIMRLVQ